MTTIPVLPVADFGAAATFYRDRLGFTVAFEAGPAYGGVLRGDDLVHLDGVVNDAAGKVTCRIETAGVEATYAELEPRGVIDPAEPLRTTPWGAKQFSVLDLDGNRITFTEPS
jgi:catechol 2,3-dioxygenase-like lactoylglutathione lyase family enzyme